MGRSVGRRGRGIGVGRVPAAQAETASPVAASTLRNGICEAGEFCLFRDPNRTGPVMDFNRGADSLSYIPFRWPIVAGNSSSLPAVGDNQASSHDACV